MTMMVVLVIALLMLVLLMALIVVMAVFLDYRRLHRPRRIPMILYELLISICGWCCSLQLSRAWVQLEFTDFATKGAGFKAYGSGLWA